MIIVTMVRCATGEAWPDIMLAGIGGRPCDPKSYNRFVLFELKMLKEVKIYFFNILRQGILSKYCRVVLTLVPTLLIPVSQEFNHRWVDRPGPDLWLGRLLRLLRLLHLLLLLHHDQPLCRRHHGQLWLPDKVWLLFETIKFLEMRSLMCPIIQQRFLHPWLPPPGRVYHILGRNRPQRRVSIIVH